MKSLRVEYSELLVCYNKIILSPDFSDLEKEIMLAAISLLGNGFERNFDRNEHFFIDKTRNILPKD